MGQYDTEIASAKKMLEEAEAEYASAAESMVGAAPHVRDFVLNEVRGRIDEAKGMIETFTQAND